MKRQHITQIYRAFYLLPSFFTGPFRCSLILVFSFYFIALTRQFLPSLRVLECVYVFLSFFGWFRCCFYLFYLFVSLSFGYLMSWTLTNKQAESDKKSIVLRRTFWERAVHCFFSSFVCCFFHLHAHTWYGFQPVQCVTQKEKCVKYIHSRNEIFANSEMFPFSSTACYIYYSIVIILFQFAFRPCVLVTISFSKE